MKRSRIGWALGGDGGMRGARARCCGRMRATPAPSWRRRTIPPNSSDLQLNSALRNNRRWSRENIEAALAAKDADLASSFVELAAREEHRR